MDEILSDMSQSKNVFDDKSGSFNDYKILWAIGELKSEISDMKNRQIGELEKRLESLQTENRQIRKDSEEKVSGLRGEIEELKKRNAAVDELREKQTAGMQAEIEELKKLTAVVDELRQQKKHMKELIEILNTFADESKKKLENLLKENLELKQNMDTINARLNGIENIFVGFSFDNNDLFRLPKTNPEYYSKSK